jgi:hypothetical protein
MIDTSASPGTSGSIDGQIVVFDRTGQLGISNVKAQIEDASAFANALQWFGGLVVPALLGFAVTLLAVHCEKLRTEWAALNALRVLENTKVESFFKDLDTVLSNNQFQRPGQQVYQHLKTYEILTILSAYWQRRIMRRCAANDMAKIVNILRRLFPTEAKHLTHARAIPRFFFISKYWTT